MLKAGLRLIIAVVCSLVLVAPSHADEAKDIDVPAGDMLAALESLARQADIDLVYQADQIRGIHTQGVRGKLTAQQAIASLLQGTTLRVSTDASSGAMMITPAEKRAESQPVATSAITGVTAGEVTLAQADADAGAGARDQVSRQGDGSIAGRVTDTSASNLAGALVRIQETGQVTQTDTLGTFRFFGLAPGEYTLSISYIGYAEKLWRVKVDGNEPRAVVYPLERAAWDLAEVTVFGTRSARAKALNLQRTADNSSSVISADLLGNFNDATISEALRRVPGIAFTRGRLGDGQNVRVRGLSENLSNVQLNGLNLPSNGLGTQRVANLNNFLADNVEKITVNDTLLPSMDSAGTGGLIQIETKAPLGRPHRYANLSMESGRRGGDFGKDVSASGTLSGVFGDQRDFGLSLSAQYLKRTGRVFNYRSNVEVGQYLPLDPFGKPSLGSRAYFDPRLTFPFEPGVTDAYPSSLAASVSDVEIDNRAITLSAEWQASVDTHLQLDVQRSLQLMSEWRRGADLNFPAAYQPLPVAALGGEMRQALVWDGTGAASQGYFFNPDAETRTDTASFRGANVRGRWSSSWKLGYAGGLSQTPRASSIQGMESFGNIVNPSFVAPDAVDLAEQRIISVFSPRIGGGMPIPRLSQAGWDYYNDPASYAFYSLFQERTSGRNNRYTAQLATQWNVDRRYLSNIEVGVNLESERFSQRSRSISYDGFTAPDFLPPTLAALGITMKPINLTAIGISGNAFELPSRSSLEELIANAPGLASGPNPRLNRSGFSDPKADAQYLQEISRDAYVQSTVAVRKLSIIGGARVASTRVKSVDLVAPQLLLPTGEFDPSIPRRFGLLQTSEATLTDVLPRVQANYRQTDNLIFRASYYRTVARPDTFQLSSSKSIFLNLSQFVGNPDGRPELTVQEGNPKLKPAVGQNFDLAGEYYMSQVGLIKLSVFYKQIRNLIDLNTSRNFDTLDGVKLPDDPRFQDLPDDILIQGQRPFNSQAKAKHWGVSLAIERQLTFLPGALSGLGFYGNYSYADNKTPQTLTWYSKPVFDGNGNLLGTEVATVPADPSEVVSTSGTASLTYHRNRLDGSLTMSWQGYGNGGIEEYGFSTTVGRVRQLDLRLDYQLGLADGKYRLYFEGSNILAGTGAAENVDEFSSPSTPEYIRGASYFGGRTLRLGVNATF